MQNANDIRSTLFTASLVGIVCVAIFIHIEVGNDAAWLMNWQARADEAEARKIEAHTELVKTRAEAEIDYAAARAMRRDTDLATLHSVTNTLWSRVERIINYGLIALLVYLWRKDTRDSDTAQEGDQDAI